MSAGQHLQPSPVATPFPISQLTLEDRITMKRCRHEAVFFKAVPLTAAALGVVYGIGRLGLLRPRGNAISTLYVVAGAATLGASTSVFVGDCRSRLAKLNTPLGRALRGEKEQSSESISYTQENLDQVRMNSSDPDMYSGLEYNTTLNADGGGAATGDAQLQQQRYTSYEELRRRNRELYERGRMLALSENSNQRQKMQNDHQNGQAAAANAHIRQSDSRVAPAPGADTHSSQQRYDKSFSTMPDAKRMGMSGYGDEGYAGQKST